MPPVILISDAALRVISVVTSITNTALCFSPFFLILQLDRNRQPNNVLFWPYALLLATCIELAIYGSFVSDYVLFVVNGLGIIPTVYFTNVLMHNADRKAQIAMKIFYQFIVIYVVVTGGLGSFLSSVEARIQVVGIMASAVLCCAVLSPLFNVYHSFRYRISSPVPILPAIAMTINAIFWVIYGLAKGDIVVYVPNMVSVLVGLLQVFAYVIFTIAPKVSHNLPSLPAQGNAATGETPNAAEAQKLVMRTLSASSSIEADLGEKPTSPYEVQLRVM